MAIDPLESVASAEPDESVFSEFRKLNQCVAITVALLAIAISVLAVTALTHFWWLYFIALVPTGFGVLMGLSGLAGWGIHPDALIRLLS